MGRGGFCVVDCFLNYWVDFGLALTEGEGAMVVEDEGGNGKAR